MTDKLKLKSSHEVVYTVDVADVDSIFQGKPTDPDILTVLMKDGKRLYCDEVCPIDSLQEEPVSPCVECASISEGCKEICYDYNKWVRDNHKEEPVSNSDWLTELQEKLDNATPEQLEELWNKYNDVDEEEPVSIWHDASEKPERDDLLIETNDGRVIHRQSINNYGMVKRWAYTSALLNLDNSCNLGNNSQEEPVSEDLEEAMKKTFWESPTFEHPAIAWEDGFRKGAKWQKTKDESTTKDLGEYINELSKQFPEVSFAKLSRIAVRVAKWQKQQDQSIIELAEDHAMLAGMEKMKEEMMKDAVIGLVHPCDETIWISKKDLSVYHEDEKVNVIIRKIEEL